MNRKYTQLTIEDRAIIGALLKEGWSIRRIGRELLRAPSTIFREIHRNFSADHHANHLAYGADCRADKRKRTSHKRPRLKNDFIRSYVEEKLVLGWSPEQIAGRLHYEYSEHSTNYESIYLYLYHEARELLNHLPHKRKNRQRRTFTRKGRGRNIPEATPITLRDPAITARNELGHWEVDTAYSAAAKGASLLVIAERKSRYIKISLLPQKTAKHTRVALIRRLRILSPHLRKTLTFDNGTENVQHHIANRALGTTSYFCHPYASYEKGTVENSIGLIKRFFPKGTDFAKVPIKTIRKVELTLNHRPRKCLNFLTPDEVFKLGCCT